MKLVYPACFYPNASGGYTVTVPDLQGCVTQGNDLAEAIEMAVDAASGWILDELEDGNKAPAASTITDVILEYDDGFISLVVLDIEAYAEKHGDKAVRKNLTIPAWLATLADKENINYSQVLKSALALKLNLPKSS